MRKTSVFVICVEAIIYLLLYNLHDCTFQHKPLKINTEGFKLELAKSVKLQGLNIDHNLTSYESRVSNICKMVRANFKNLSRITNVLNDKQAKLTYIFYFVSVKLLFCNIDVLQLKRSIGKLSKY